MVQEKYGVRLATQEKGRLRKMIRAGRSSAQAITRARILIKIDVGWTAPQVATALDVSERNAIGATINWRFTAQDARRKRLYPCQS